MNQKEYIKSDLHRLSGSDSQFLKYYFKNPSFRYLVSWRLMHDKGFAKFLGKILWFFRPLKNHIILPLNVKIGYGLFIGHNGPIVISASTVIGNNCNLSQFVTIGSNKGHAATIGDEVYIGPSTCIVEDVKIGSKVTIGAGSVVTKDLPDNSTCAGNYAKVLNYRNPGRYILNKWEKH